MAKKPPIINNKMLNPPIQCNACKTQLVSKNDGFYMCPKCGLNYTDNYGKVKEYLFNNPNCNFQDIVNNTYVPQDIIEYFINEGYIDFPDSNKNFSKCQTCGASIIKGRYCSKCSLRTLNLLKKELR